MGKSKTTTSNKVDPWIPTQETFDKFRGYGQSLMTDRFTDALDQAGRTQDRAANWIGYSPTLTAEVRNQRSAPALEGLADSASQQAINSNVNPMLAGVAQRATTGGIDPRLDQAVTGAQSPQYAQGFQSTLNEMQDPNARSAAFQQVKQNVTDDVLKSVNSTFAGQGMTGSSLHQQNLAKGITAGLAGVENDAFQQSQARAMQAAQVGQSELNNQRQFGLGAAQVGQNAQNQLMGQQVNAATALNAAEAQNTAQGLQAAGLRQGAYVQGLDRSMNAAQTMQDVRQQQFGNLLGLSSQQAGLGQQYQGAYQSGVQGLMGAATSGASQSSTQSQSPGLTGILGAGLQVASLFSDERLKTDKKRVGKLDDGTPVYTYKYKDGVSPELEGKTLMGVMAQQVKKKKAVQDDPSGFKRVDYGVL